VCGDTRDGGDYICDEGVAVRICGDCKGIQEQMYGAMFLPLE
jgi:hypothetical protein